MLVKVISIVHQDDKLCGHPLFDIFFALADDLVTCLIATRFEYDQEILRTWRVPIAHDAELVWIIQAFQFCPVRVNKDFVLLMQFVKV